MQIDRNTRTKEAGVCVWGPERSCLDTSLHKYLGSHLNCGASPNVVQVLEKQKKHLVELKLTKTLEE